MKKNIMTLAWSLAKAAAYNFDGNAKSAKLFFAACLKQAWSHYQSEKDIALSDYNGQIEVCDIDWIFANAYVKIAFTGDIPAKYILSSATSVIEQRLLGNKMMYVLTFFLYCDKSNKCNFKVVKKINSAFKIVGQLI